MSNYNEVFLGFQFIYAMLSADSTLAGLAPGGVWRGLAPPGTATPYVVLVYQAGTDAVTMNGYRMIVDALYQVKAVGPANISETIAAASARLDKLLGGPPSQPASGAVIINAVNEGQVLACYRQSPLMLDELVSGELWTSIGGLYRTEIEQIAT